MKLSERTKANLEDSVGKTLFIIGVILLLRYL